MRKSMLMCAMFVTLSAIALEANYVDGEQSPNLVTPELQAAAAQMFGAQQAHMLLHAASLQMAKYDNDMKTAAGRKAWHGKLIGEEVDTNTLQKVEIYSNTVNGAVWRYRSEFKPRPVIVRSVGSPPMPCPIGTNGIPAKLAAARARRNEIKAQGTITTNVIIKAGN